MTAGRRLLGVLLLTLAGLLGGAGVASAHTGLEGSTPGEGGTVSSLSAPVRLHFADPVLKGTAAAVLTGPEGRVELARPSVRGASVTFRLPKGTAAGRHRLAWRVVADDGHPVEGVLTFTVAARAVAAPSPAPSASSSSGAAVAPRSAVPTTAATPTDDVAATALAATESAGTDAASEGGPFTGWAAFALLLVLALALPRWVARRRPAPDPGGAR
ncbi:copper resistance CopC family protein [Phycicoccus avicenniae]|uniref:copper resistance CopC family protein n=1 Tax=Phycicoccus avicenniae TaxID=2828860 RepID=UPI003D29FE8E